jgi:hypothetical protein
MQPVQPVRLMPANWLRLPPPQSPAAPWHCRVQALQQEHPSMR